MLNRLKTCCVKGCGRPVTRRGWASNRKDLCSAHFQRLLRVGSVMADRPIIKKHRGINRNPDGTQRECAANGCDRLATSRGFCHLHWKRIGRNGDPYSHIPAWKLREYKAALRVERAG